VLVQMAEVFVIHVALKVHPQGLRESVCLHVHTWMSVCGYAFVCARACVCVLCLLHGAEDAINACC